jgi:hypothetical protein
MRTINYSPLFLAFVIVVIIFLLFTGGAITMTMTQSQMNSTSLMSSVSWLWVPALVALLLSVLLGWTIFGKKAE